MWWAPIHLVRNPMIVVSESRRLVGNHSKNEVEKISMMDASHFVPLGFRLRGALGFLLGGWGERDVDRRLMPPMLPCEDVRTAGHPFLK